MRSEERAEREDMSDPEQIQVSLPCDNSVEEPKTNDERDTEEHQNNRRLQSSLQAIAIVILIVVLIGVTLFAGIKSIQCQTQNSQLSLNSTHKFTISSNEYDQLMMRMNATQENITFLSSENTQLRLLLGKAMKKQTELSLLLEKALQGKAQLEKRLNSTHQNFTSAVTKCDQLMIFINATLKNITLLSAEKTEWKQLLNSTYQSLTHLENEYGQLQLLLNTTLHNVTLTSAEKTKLSLLLKNTTQNKTELILFFKKVLQENVLLRQLQNTTHQNFTFLGREYSQLKLFMNATIHNLTLLSAENSHLSLLLKNISQEKKHLTLLLEGTLQDKTKLQVENRQLTNRLRQLLDNAKQTSTQLEKQNQRQRSILFSNKLSFLWRFCNRSTLQCTRCPLGWVEHASRCFFFSLVSQKWEKARRECLNYGGDLAIVLNDQDQTFLTNMTMKFIQQHPQQNIQAAWIGLQDMVKEGTYVWVNGNKLQSNLNYWKKNEPNNAMASWDKSNSGQDCIAINPTHGIEKEGWEANWDDIVCGGKRHFICESKALILSK